METEFIHRNDLDELRRLATNSYDSEQKFMNRVINGIYAMDKEIVELRAEVAKLKGEK